MILRLLPEDRFLEIKFMETAAIIVTVQALTIKRKIMNSLILYQELMSTKFAARPSRHPKTSDYWLQLQTAIGVYTSSDWCLVPACQLWASNTQCLDFSPNNFTTCCEFGQPKRIWFHCASNHWLIFATTSNAISKIECDIIYYNLLCPFIAPCVRVARAMRSFSIGVPLVNFRSWMPIMKYKIQRFNSAFILIQWKMCESLAPNIKWA